MHQLLITSCKHVFYVLTANCLASAINFGFSCSFLLSVLSKLISFFYLSISKQQQCHLFTFSSMNSLSLKSLTEVSPKLESFLKILLKTLKILNVFRNTNSRTGRKYSHSDHIITKCQDIIILVFSPAIKLKTF